MRYPRAVRTEKCTQLSQCGSYSTSPAQKLPINCPRATLPPTSSSLQIGSKLKRKPRSERMVSTIRLLTSPRKVTVPNTGDCNGVGALMSKPRWPGANLALGGLNSLSIDSCRNGTGVPKTSGSGKGCASEASKMIRARSLCMTRANQRPSERLPSPKTSLDKA